MAQVKIPAELALQIALLNNIIAKNTSDGADSPLAPWLIEKAIDLAADAQAGKEASDHETLRATLEATSKINYAARDSKFNPVFTFIRQAAQVLKKFYAPNNSLLADWSLPVTDSGRINYPASFEERQALATRFFAKLASYGEGKSPLAVFIKKNAVNVAALAEDNATAAASNADAEAAAKKAENATEQRDLLWATPLAHIHAIADYLKSLYPANPRQLGEWGFKVDESERKSVLRKSRLGLAEIRTVTGVALNSILTNTGTVAILIYKGKAATGTSVTLKPADKMGILKGYSTITVQNTSTLEMAEYTIEIQQ